MKSSTFASAALFAGLAAANTTSTCYSCYEPTTTVPVACPYYNTATCVVPECIELKTTVIPSKTCDYTYTADATCVTACPTGCATSITTITDSTDSCVPTSPASGCFTATTTSGTINCPAEPVCGYGGITTSTITVTRPTSNPYCATTPTDTVPPSCPTSCSTSTTVTITAQPYGTTTYY